MTAEEAARIPALLDALGGTREEVAATLRARGIKGKLCDRCHCPIARALYQDVGIPEPTDHNGEIRVNRTDVMADLPGEDEYGFRNRELVPLPQAAKEFVARFDFGDHPDLLEKP